MVGRAAGKIGGRAADTDATLEQNSKIKCLRTYKEGGAREGECSEKGSEKLRVTLAVT